MSEKTCFIDADVFVNAFVPLDDKRNRTSRELLTRLEQGQINLLTDYFALAEAHYIIEKYKGTDKASEVIRKILTFAHLEIVAVDGFAFFEALKRTEKYQLKINDLVHYTIALLRNASGIYSYDKDFNGLEIKRLEP